MPSSSSMVWCGAARGLHWLRAIARRSANAVKVTCERRQSASSSISHANSAGTCSCKTAAKNDSSGVGFLRAASAKCAGCCAESAGRRGGSLFHLVCLNMLVCGIEFCASAGFTYIPPMLLKAGFRESFMTCVMGIGPFIALITVPILGRWSDRCQSSLGRRRPFILGISSIMIVSLILIAFGQAFSAVVAPGLRLGVVLLVLGVIILDFCCHAGFNPCEALVADMVKKSSNKEQGFTVYSNMVSLGGCIGYLISAVDWSSSYGSQEQTAFSFILILFVPSLIVTLIVAEDRQRLPTKVPLLRSIESSRYPPTPNTSTTTTNNNTPHQQITFSSVYDDVGYETGSNDSNENLALQSRPSTPQNNAATTTTTAYIGGVMTADSRRSMPRFEGFSLMALLCGGPRRAVTSFTRSVRRFMDVPLALRRLFVSDFCSWTALMCHNMYYSDYVGQAVYGGNPTAEEHSIGRQLYDSGIRMGSLGLLLHSITSIIYASYLQNKMLKWCGMQVTYLFGLAVFTFAMMATMMTSNLIVINMMAALSGTGFAAITTIPYMLVTAYHSDKDVYFNDDTKSSTLPTMLERRMEADEAVVEDGSDSDDEDGDDEGESRGFGGDIAILDAAYILSQIVLSLFVGTLVDLTHSVTMYLVVAATFGFVACYCSTRVVFPADTRSVRTQDK